MGEAVTDIANSKNIFIDDSAGLRISDVRSRARRLSREVKQLGLIVVDYIQLMSGEGKSVDTSVKGYGVCFNPLSVCGYILVKSVVKVEIN